MTGQKRRKSRRSGAVEAVRAQMESGGITKLSITHNSAFEESNLYFTAVAAAILIKMLYRNAESCADAPGLLLFLKPLSTAVGLFFGIPFEFDAST